MLERGGAAQERGAARERERTGPATSAGRTAQTSTSRRAEGRTRSTSGPGGSGTTAPMAATPDGGSNATAPPTSPLSAFAGVAADDGAAASAAAAVGAVRVVASGARRAGEHAVAREHAATDAGAPPRDPQRAVALSQRCIRRRRGSRLAAQHGRAVAGAGALTARPPAAVDDAAPDDGTRSYARAAQSAGALRRAHHEAMSEGRGGARCRRPARRTRQLRVRRRPSGARRRSGGRRRRRRRWRRARSLRSRRGSASR